MRSEGTRLSIRETTAKALWGSAVKLGTTAAGLMRRSAAFDLTNRPAYSMEGTEVNPFRLPEEHLQFPQAFALVPTIYSCISLIQGTIAGLPLRFYNAADKEIEFDAILKPLTNGQKNVAQLWTDPNPEDTGRDLVEQIIGSLLINGNGYVFLDYGKVETVPPRIREMHCLPGHQVTPKVSEQREIVGYVWTLDDGREVLIKRKNMLHFRLYSPKGSFIGLSPIQVLELTYKTRRNADRYQDVLFRRGGAVAGHWEHETPLSDPIRRRVVSELRRQGEGIENSLSPFIVPTGLKRVADGLNMQQLQFLETMGYKDRDIARLFKVPPVMLGMKETGAMISGDSGGSTDRTLYWEVCIEPLTDKVTATITRRLLQASLYQGEFPPGTYCKFDTSKVAALQGARLDMMTKAKGMTLGPVLSTNEVRHFGDQPESEKEEHNEIPDMPEPTVPGAPPKPGGSKKERARQAPPKDGHPVVSSWDNSMVETARSRQDARVDRQIRDVARPAVRKLLRQQEARVIKAIRSSARDEQAAAPVIQAVVNVEDLLHVTEVDRALVKRMISAIMRNAGNAELTDLGLNISFDLTANDVRRWLEQRSEIAVVGTTNTTRDQLRRTLAEGVRDRESLGELVARVREVFSDRYFAQGETIARTETIASYNYAANQSWKQSGVVKSKRWVTSRDERVRPAHESAEGQTVALDSPFVVAGQELMFPGDHEHGASADNTINCRCTAVPEVGAPTAAPTRNPTVAEILSRRNVIPSAAATNGGSK